MGWKQVHKRAFELALDGIDVAAAAETLLATSDRDRTAFDIARIHYLGQIDDHSDKDVCHALASIEEALWRGDVSKEWSLWGHANPWDLARFAA